MDKDKKALTAEILCVGTELLLGDIVNTNAAYLSRQLAELGIRVYKHTAVGDNPARLRRALDAAFAEADILRSGWRIISPGMAPYWMLPLKRIILPVCKMPSRTPSRRWSVIGSFTPRSASGQAI